MRPLRRVRVWSPNPGRRDDAAAELAAELGIEVRAVASPAEAVQGAPLVAACTLSDTPVVRAADLAPGATVLSVGSFEADRSEVDAELVRTARVVVDHVDTSLTHAGPVVRAIAAGELEAGELVSLGEVLVGSRPGRTGPDQVVFYNSVGLGVQDAAAAHAVLAAHRREHR